MRHVILLVTLAALGLSACASIGYAIKERFGIEKRDILVARVVDAREDQAEAQEQFKTALERFQELTGNDGGSLEKAYKRFSSEYEDSADAADDVRSRIKSVEKVAGDLFAEWEGELDEYSSDEARRNSEQQLQQTKDRYGVLLTSMKKAEASMDPVLAAFKDQVLSLKHSLNAQAISSLEGTAVRIQDDVSALIEQMEASIREADAFIEEFKPAG